MEDRETRLFVETDAEPRKGIRSYRAIAFTSVMSKWYASCNTLGLEKEKEFESWNQLHVGGGEVSMASVVNTFRL